LRPPELAPLSLMEKKSASTMAALPLAYVPF
jgi:hypothetical protein